MSCHRDVQIPATFYYVLVPVRRTIMRYAYFDTVTTTVPLRLLQLLLQLLLLLLPQLLLYGRSLANNQSSEPFKLTYNLYL
jgi:hypothetical protein